MRQGDNKHEDKKLNAGRGTVGESAVLGVQDRKTNQITAKVIEPLYIVRGAGVSQ